MAVVELYWLFDSPGFGYFAVSARTFKEALDIAMEKFGDFESLGQISEIEADNLDIDVF